MLQQLENLREQLLPAQDDYHIGSIGPVEVQRPFRVSKASLAQLPGWGGYYFPGMALAKGSFRVENISSTPLAFWIWAQIDPSVLPGPEFPIAEIRAAQVGPGGLAPWVELSSLSDLQIGSGEAWEVEYRVIVAPYSWPGRVERIDVRIDNLPLCPLPTGGFEICGMNEYGEMG